MEWNRIESNRIEYLKANSSTDHSANIRATRPATVDLAFSPYISVRATNGHAAGAAKALIVGVE